MASLILQKDRFLLATTFGDSNNWGSSASANDLFSDKIAVIAQ
jgi:hypothetical protein